MSEKKQTSKSVMREIERAKGRYENILQKQTELKKEKAELSKKIKELEKQYGILAAEEFTGKIATALQGIDTADEQAVARAVSGIFAKQEQNCPADVNAKSYVQEKVDISINFSEYAHQEEKTVRTDSF